MFQVGLPSRCYLGLNSGRSVSINVNKMRKHFSRNIHGARMFLQCFPVSHTGNIVSSVSFCIQDANYACATRQGILTKIRACEHLQKFCEHEKASTHLIFASNSSKGQILRALSNWMGPFHTPNFPVRKKFFVEMKTVPVVPVSFGGGLVTWPNQLNSSEWYELMADCREAGVDCWNDSFPFCLSFLRLAMLLNEKGLILPFWVYKLAPSFWGHGANEVKAPTHDEEEIARARRSRWFTSGAEKPDC